MKIAGIILAGGASRRMGSPKALLDYGGETFLDRLIRLFRTHCDQVTVVLGHNHEAILAGVRRSGEARFLYNERHAQGQLTSLQCGLHASDNDAVDLYLYSPVDYPGIRSATIQSMIEAADRDSLFVIPRYEGRRGHPIIFQAQIRSEFLKLSGDAQARDVVHRHAHRTRYVDVEDPGILRDVDNPAAYQELLKTVEMQ